MLHAFRRATGNATATYQDLHAATGTPVSTVPATADEALLERLAAMIDARRRHT